MAIIERSKPYWKSSVVLIPFDVCVKFINKLLLTNVTFTERKGFFFFKKRRHRTAIIDNDNTKPKLEVICIISPNFKTFVPLRCYSFLL